MSGEAIHKLAIPKLFLYFMSLQLRRIICFFIFAPASVGLYWSIRLGWADWLAREATVPASLKSIELAPGNSTFLQYAAIVADNNGGDGTPFRRKASAINPLDSENWIRFSTHAELQNNLEEAEHD